MEESIGAGASHPPLHTKVVTTADSCVAAKVLTPAGTDAATEDRHLDIRAILEAGWARSEPGYRRLAE